MDCNILLPQFITEYEHIGSWSGYRFHWNTHSLPEVNILCLTCVNEEWEIKAEKLTDYCPACSGSFASQVFPPTISPCSSLAFFQSPKAFYSQMPKGPCNHHALLPLQKCSFYFPTIFFFNKVTPNHPSDLISCTMSTGTHSLTAVIMQNLH